MEATGVGVSWLAMLLLALGGGTSNDLVSLIDAKDYFKAHKVEVTVTKMARLAAGEPAEAGSPVAQLLALRWLGEHAAEVKKAEKFDSILRRVERVAKGEKAQDPAGFAAEYARRAARALGAETRPGQTGTTKARAKSSGLAWFPKAVRLVGRMRLRSGQRQDGDGKDMRKALAKLMPLPDRKEFYKLADKLGNVRVDRISFAYSLDPQARAEARFYVRLTGKLDRQRFLNFIRQAVPDVKFEQPKGGRDGRVTLIHFPVTERGPGLVLIGDTDLLVGVFERGGPRVNHEEVVGQMLAIRAGKEKSVFDSPLAKSLKTVAAVDDGFVVGSLPPEVRAALTRGPDAFRALPDAFFLKMERRKGGVKLRLDATMSDAKQATMFAADVKRLKKKGLEGLKDVPEEARRLVSPKGIGQLAKLLESVEVRANGPAVHGEMTVSPGAVRVLLLLTGARRTMEARPPEVRPTGPAPPRKR